MTNYKGWSLDFAPSRPFMQRYIAQRFGNTLYASHPVHLLGLVNNFIFQTCKQGDCHA